MGVGSGPLSRMGGGAMMVGMRGLDLGISTMGVTVIMAMAMAMFYQSKKLEKVAELFVN